MRTASEWAAAIRSGQISAREALDHHLDVVARRNPEINAVVTLAGEEARERAGRADAALAEGEPVNQGFRVVGATGIDQ